MLVHDLCLTILSLLNLTFIDATLHFRLRMLFRSNASDVLLNLEV